MTNNIFGECKINLALRFPVHGHICYWLHPVINPDMRGYCIGKLKSQLESKDVLVLKQARSQDFSWGGGGAYVKNRDQIINFERYAMVVPKKSVQPRYY